MSELRSVQECLSVQEWLSFGCLDKAEQDRAEHFWAGQGRTGQGKGRAGQGKDGQGKGTHLTYPSLAERTFVCWTPFFKC